MLNQAKLIEKEIIENRRTIHKIAEIEFELKETLEFVIHELRSYGIEPKKIGKAGITFTLGEMGKTILLRADMDALPMKEETNLPYKSINGNAHTCGHDAHVAMLLGAAKLLKDNEKNLKGRVKFMFQPAEEILAGALDMIDNGILEDPKVDVAFAFHIVTGIEDSKSGNIYYNEGALTSSGDAMRVIVIGQEAHGSAPYLGIDAIQIAANIITAINGMVSNEFPTNESNIAIIGKITGGTAINTVADKVEIEISLRSRNRESRKKLIKRVEEISNGIANTFRGKVEVEHLYGMPGLINNKDLTLELISYAKELIGIDNIGKIDRFNGSEDFSMISERVPASLFTIGVGSIDEGYNYYLHHAKLNLNEDVLYIGSASYAYMAMRWLEENKE